MSDVEQTRSPVDRIIIGTAQFGMDYGVANRDGQVTTVEANRILSTGDSCGIHYIDTAHAYGESEEIIGQYLVGHKKQAWSVITKVCDNELSITEQVRLSVARLGQQPYAVLAHRASDYLGNCRFRDEMSALKDNFGVKKIGVSVYSRKDVMLVLERFVPDIIQLPVNVLDMRAVRSGVLSLLGEERVEVHARSIFLQGLLYLPRKILESQFPSASSAIDKLGSIAKKARLSLGELSLLCALSLPGIDKVLVGVNSAEQLKQHIIALRRSIGEPVLAEVLDVSFDDEMVLNPSKWNTPFDKRNEPHSLN